MEMRELVDLVNRYAKEYYENDRPTVSDAEYDALYDRLFQLEKETGVVLPDSPTHRVGGTTLKNFVQYNHKLRLYSLDKAKTEAELDGYFAKVIKAIGYFPWMTVEHKYDGLTLSITYKDGDLVTAATRGDGVTGEDVTAQVRTIKSVPLTIPHRGEIEIQGEGVMRLSAFRAYNETADTPLKNARNGVAGAIRNLNPKVTASRNLDFVAYNIGYSEFYFSAQSKMNAFLQDNGFLTDEIFMTTNDPNEIKTVLKTIDEKRAEIDFLIDGAVIKIDEVPIRDELGTTDKFPRWALAYKFEAEETTTVLNDVIWQVSRTGRINPLAVLEPVDLMGVTVQRATLNNYLDIQKKDIKVHSRVFIRRSNDVIPEIMGVAEHTAESQEVKKPERCPSCGGVVKEEGAFLFCTDYAHCAPARVSALDHFASKPCMNIEGFSEKTAEQLFNECGVKSPYQLYDLSKEDLLKLEGFKDKKAQNILDSLEKSKFTTLDRFIFAMGIPTIGKKTAKELADAFTTLDNLKKATVEELLKLDDFGEIMAGNVTAFFQSPGNLEEIEKLIERGISFRTEEKLDGIFSGRNVVLTGSLSSYKRGKAAEIIISLGGKMSETVSKSVNLLIVGADAGSKKGKAEKLGIEIWDEEHFLQALAQYTNI